MHLYLGNQWCKGKAGEDNIPGARYRVQRSVGQEIKHPDRRSFEPSYPHHVLSIETQTRESHWVEYEAIRGNDI